MRWGGGCKTKDGRRVRGAEAIRAWVLWVSGVGAANGACARPAAHPPPSPRKLMPPPLQGCLPIAHPDHMRPDKLGGAELVEEVEVRGR